ncbi:MAG: hypothetical protein WDM92_13480 [Caulobacteraceae bacterium]
MTPDWREHLDQAKSKTAHLMRKLDRLNSPERSVLFYREAPAAERFDPALYQELAAAAAARVPLARTSFLLISPKGLAAPGWTSLRIDDPRAEPWSGDPAVWDPALASLGYTVRPPERRDEASPAARTA